MSLRNLYAMLGFGNKNEVSSESGQIKDLAKFTKQEQEFILERYPDERTPLQFRGGDDELQMVYSIAKKTWNDSLVKRIVGEFAELTNNPSFPEQFKTALNAILKERGSDKDKLEKIIIAIEKVDSNDREFAQLKDVLHNAMFPSYHEIYPSSYRELESQAQLYPRGDSDSSSELDIQQDMPKPRLVEVLSALEPFRLKDPKYHIGIWPEKRVDVIINQLETLSQSQSPTISDAIKNKIKEILNEKTFTPGEKLYYIAYALPNMTYDSQNQLLKTFMQSLENLVPKVGGRDVIEKNQDQINGVASALTNLMQTIKKPEKTGLFTQQVEKEERSPTNNIELKDRGPTK